MQHKDYFGAYEKRQSNRRTEQWRIGRKEKYKKREVKRR